MGVPVTSAFGCGSASAVSANVTASTLARRATNRTLRPGTTLPSQSTLGIRSRLAASSVGMAT